jgi:hypothetical protein
MKNVTLISWKVITVFIFHYNDILQEEKDRRNLSSLIVFLSIFSLMNKLLLAWASARALRKEESAYCPMKRANKVVYAIQPGKKLAEVSYMAHSNQLFNGKATVVW